MNETAKEAGFAFPVAITARVHSELVEWTDEDAKRKPRVYQDVRGRLWDVVYMAMFRLRLADRRDVSKMFYRLKVVPRPGNGRQQLQVLRMVVSSGDRGEPVITIMFPHEF